MDHALINRMGFNNQGVASAVHRLHRRNRFYHRRHPVVLGGNLGKNTLTPNEKAPADYLRLFRSLYEYVNYFVINVSCPNVANLSCLQNKEHLKKLLEGLIDFAADRTSYRPILLKISPDLERRTDRRNDRSAGRKTGLGRYRGDEHDHQPPRAADPVGPRGRDRQRRTERRPADERSLEMVRYIHKKTEGRFPIIGVGGIMTEDDAVAMLDAGASLIEVYTGFI